MKPRGFSGDKHEIVNINTAFGEQNPSKVSYTKDQYINRCVQKVQSYLFSSNLFLKKA